MTLTLEPREFRLLDGLRLNARKSFSGRVRGERLTRKKGVSIEFADYREYSDGDDLRHLDWNVLARLDTPVMRTYQDEEDLAVHLLVDASPSMEFGDPTKASQARRIACALGYMALAGGDAVVPRTLGPRAAPPRAVRGRAGYVRLTQWLDTLSAEKPAPQKPDGLAVSLRAFAKTSVRTGLVCLITDALDPDFAPAVRALAGRGHEVWLIQILSPIELDPDLEGDLRLQDGEGGRIVEITANSYVLREYRRRLEEHNQSLVDAIRRVGGRYALVPADAPLDRFIKDPLKREGWVAGR